MTDKKKPLPKKKPVAASCAATHKEQHHVNHTAANVADNTVRIKPKPKPKPKAKAPADAVLVADLRLRYCVSKEDGPTSPLLVPHNAHYDEFMELWQPGKKWDKSQDGGYMAKGERQLPKVKVTAKNNNGYIVPFTKETMRSNSAMQSQQVFLLDYDRMAIGTLADVQRKLRKSGYWFTTYTTASHLASSKDGLECFRVAFVTSSAMTNPYDMTLARVSFDDWLCRQVSGLEVDRASFALSQPMFLPPHGSDVVTHGKAAVPVAFLRQHFAAHDLSVHHNTDVKADAVVPDYIDDLFAPLAQMLIDLGGVNGRDGRILLPASAEHAEQYTSESKQDDFAFMFPYTGVADQLNVGFIHGSDLEQRDAVKPKPKETPGKYAERRRMAQITYACTAVTEDGPERQRLLLVMRETLDAARDAWQAAQDADTLAALSDDDDDAAPVSGTRALAVISQAKERVKAWTDADDAALDAGAGILEAKAGGTTAARLAEQWLASPLCSLQVAYDRFMQRPVFRVKDGDRWQPMADWVLTRLWSDFNEMDDDYQLTRGDMAAVCELVMSARQFDSAQEWAKTLEWDGVERLPGFFHDHFGVEASEYTTAASMAFWMGAAGRLKYPGIKFDLTPILTGAQGMGKTSTVRALCPSPDFFGTMSPKEKEKVRKMKGKLIMELAELETLRSMDDMGELKSFLTEQEDTDRIVYGKFHQQLPRRCVFVATSNPKDILRDDTGERRWLPLAATHADPEHTASLREQLWAEAIHKCTRAEVKHWHYVAEELARTVVEQFKQEDPLREVLTEIMEEMGDPDGLPQPATSSAIMMRVMQVKRAGGLGDYSVTDRKLAASLRLMGYVRAGRLKEWKIP